MAYENKFLSGIGVLSAVIEAGSFNRAGAALGLTQSAVSRAVSRLEKRIGIQIFDRSSRAIRLTDEGRRFFEAVAPHLEAIEDAALAAGGAKTQVRGRLRVNTDETVGQYLLCPHLDRFLSKHPDVSVEISAQDRMGDFVAEGFDVAIRFGPARMSSLICRQLLKTPVITCASPDYLVRHGHPRHPSDLQKGHRCVLHRDPATGRHFPWEFLQGRKLVTPDISGQLMVNTGSLLVEACLGGYGVAQFLQLYMKTFLADGRLVQVLPDWAEETYPLYAYHHSPKLITAKVRVFLDFVKSLVD